MRFPDTKFSLQKRSKQFGALKIRNGVSAIFSCKVEGSAPQRQSTRLSYQHIFDRDPKNGVTCPTVARAYKSSRKPLKNGWRTLPAADLAPIFDFGKKLRLNPDAAMRNLFRVGLRLPDQRRQFLAQFRRRGLVEAVIDRAEMSVLLPAADMRVNGSFAP